MMVMSNTNWNETVSIVLVIRLVFHWRDVDLLWRNKVHTGCTHPRLLLLLLCRIVD